MAASQLRSQGWVRIGYAMVLLTRPGAVLQAVAGRPSGPRGRATVRVLGLREAGQALVCAPRPTAEVLKIGAAVDFIHAATMLALATSSTTWRRPALASAAVATTYAVISSRDAARLSPASEESLRPAARAGATPSDRLLDLRDRCARTVLDR